MGPPLWLYEEEEFLETFILPRSDYATGVLVPGSGLPFAELAPIMQAEMNRRGINRRIYTGEILFQHYYQRHSNRAKDRFQLVEHQPLTVATTPRRPVPHDQSSPHSTPSSNPRSSSSRQRGVPRIPHIPRTPLNPHISPSPFGSANRRCPTTGQQRHNRAYPMMMDHAAQTKISIPPNVDTNGSEGIRYGESGHDFDFTRSAHTFEESQYPEDAEEEQDRGRTLERRKYFSYENDQLSENVLSYESGSRSKNVSAYESDPHCLNVPSYEGDFRSLNISNDESRFGSDNASLHESAFHDDNASPSQHASRQKRVPRGKNTSIFSMQEAIAEAKRMRHPNTEPAQLPQAQPMRVTYSRRHGQLKPIRTPSPELDESPFALPPTRLTPTQPTFEVSPARSFISPIASQMTTPGLPQTRLGPNQPTFEVSPGFSYRCPTASQTSTPAGRAQNKTPPSLRQNDLLEMMSSWNAKSPSKSPAQSLVKLPAQLRVASPAKDTTKEQSSPPKVDGSSTNEVESPLADNGHKNIPPVPLFDGSLSKFSSQPKKKISLAEYSAAKSKLKETMTSLSIGNSPATLISPVAPVHESTVHYDSVSQHESVLPSENIPHAESASNLDNVSSHESDSRSVRPVTPYRNISASSSLKRKDTSLSPLQEQQDEKRVKY